MAENTLYFGDNLKILRDNIRDESVDLIYLDPPFNSKANYNVLFRSPKGHESHAQITAFEDTWHWGEQAESEFDELIRQPNTDVSKMMVALRDFLGANDMMAYLTMMANRLLELHRVLKPTGSLYLHCDPTASHFLKIVLDGVFGKEKFRNEVIWQRTGGHYGANRWGPIHDTLLFFTKTDSYCWNKLYASYDEGYINRFYRFQDSKGKYQVDNLTGSGVRSGESGKPWRGINPTQKSRHWAVPVDILQAAYPGEDLSNLSTQEKLDKLDAANLIAWPEKVGGVPRLKRYLDLAKGIPVQDIITDIPPISAHAAERLGYPTQKPLALLERIIEASSNEGDVLLDPFCGCGTAIHAAQKLKRQWIGIDITHLAISLVEKRLRDAFSGIKLEVHGTPKDLESARDLAQRDKYQFQWWACSLVNAQPFQGKKKGADSGIDGLIYFQDDKGLPKKIVVSVKAGENIGVSMIRDFAHVVDREKAALGLFVTLAEPTRAMKEEAAAFGFYESLGTIIFPKLQILTIKGLLDRTVTARYPDLTRGGLTFKKAKKEKAEEQDHLF